MDLACVPCLGDLRPLAALLDLELSGCAHIADLRPLAALPDLANLNLSSCRAATDLAQLGAPAKLVVLDVSGFRGALRATDAAGRQLAALGAACPRLYRVLVPRDDVDVARRALPGNVDVVVAR